MFDPKAVPSGAASGVAAAMAMTGMRRLTTELGLVEEVPPQAVLRQKTPLLFDMVSREHDGAVVELVHWTYGGLGLRSLRTPPSGRATPQVGGTGVRPPRLDHVRGRHRSGSRAGSGQGGAADGKVHDRPRPPGVWNARGEGPLTSAEWSLMVAV